MAAAWIKVSDGRVLISHERLQAMYQGLPALELLFEGHPKMLKTESTTERSRCYSLHEDFDVTKEDMYLLMKFFSPTPIMPTSEEEWKKLQELGTLFGSSDAVDKAYLEWLSTEPKAAETADYNPLIPTADTKEEFEWFTFTRFPRVYSLQVHMTEQRLLSSKMDDGFVFASHAISNPKDETTLYHYRKKKAV